VNIDPTIVFGVQSTLSYAVLVLMARWFVAPYLATQPVRKVMLLLLAPHLAHHIGLAVLVPGVVGAAFPADFARIITVGELIMLVLLMVCMGALKNRSVRAPVFLWVFTVTGLAYNVIGDWVALLDGPTLMNNFNAHWYVSVFYVPVLFVSHILVLMNLVKRGQELRQELGVPQTAAIAFSPRDQRRRATDLMGDVGAVASRRTAG
jgi:hypothetical protein